MITALGSSPISGVVSAGRSEFMSIFRRGPSTAFGDAASRYPRPYTKTRGILIRKEFVENSPTIDLSKGYRFQFNPQTVSDTKETLYETRQYVGLSYNDYIWGGGGERIVSFQLFLDNTPQSKQRSFNPEAYGSKVAHEFKTTGAGYSYDNKGNIVLDKTYFGKGVVDEIKSQYATIKESFAPSKGPEAYSVSAGTIRSNGAFSISRIDERGILPEVELIQSFLYPAPLGNEKTPMFAEGGIVSKNQFRPPSTVILALGPLYLEGVIKSAPVTYTLFDKDLTPIRGTIDIEFAVFEFENITRRIDFKAY